MHKYQPRVHVICKESGEELSPVKAVPTGDGVKAFFFPETVFTTVTAYQNQQVIDTTSCYNCPMHNLITQIIKAVTKCHINSWNEEDILRLSAFSFY